jgi:hypothetical protein
MACGAACVARRILHMHQRHLTCMMVAADLDWCGAGGAAQHARLIGGMGVLCTVLEAITTFAETSNIHAFSNRVLLTCSL